MTVRLEQHVVSHRTRRLRADLEPNVTIISGIEVDHSNALAKQFALLVSGYIDHPAAAKEDAAQVPLENLFRILEMYRYDAFEAETRRGVLALEKPLASRKLPQQAAQSWHTAIKKALSEALVSAFGRHATKEQAIEELQQTLRGLASGRALDPPVAKNARVFFSTFRSSLT